MPRFLDAVFTVIVTLLLLAVIAGAAMAQGRIRAVDGDTIDLNGVRYRLWGIQAPEMSHLGGPEAKAFLQIVLDTSERVSCQDVRGTSWGRIVTVCRADGMDLGWLMVATGLAADWPRYSGGYYAGGGTMITEARINGARRRLAPKKWEDVRIGDKCVLARAVHSLPSGSIHSVEERFESLGDGQMVVLSKKPGVGLVAVDVDDLLFLIEDEPVEVASLAGEWWEYEIESLGGNVILVRGGNLGWSCRITAYTTGMTATVPPDMPEPARAALQQWLSDRIVIEEVDQ